MFKLWWLILAGLLLVLTGCVTGKSNKGRSQVVDPIKARCENDQKQVFTVYLDMTADWACKTTGMCAHAERVEIVVPHPAEINLTKYKTVAFTEIGGNYGESFAAAVKSQMIGKDNHLVAVAVHVGCMLHSGNPRESPLQAVGQGFCRSTFTLCQVEPELFDFFTPTTRPRQLFRGEERLASRTWRTESTNISGAMVLGRKPTAPLLTIAPR